MIVGISQLTFHLPDVRSLKAKRHIVRRLCERLRNKFSISVAEVGSQDIYQETKIGITVVGSDSRLIHSLLDQIRNVAIELQLAPLLDYQFEVLHYNDQIGKGLLSDLEDELDDGEESKVDLDDYFNKTFKGGNAWDYMDEWSMSEINSNDKTNKLHSNPIHSTPSKNNK